MAHYYPEANLNDTDEAQMEGYLQNVEKLERFKSQQLSQQLGHIITKILGAK